MSQKKKLKSLYKKYIIFFDIRFISSQTPHPIISYGPLHKNLSSVLKILRPNDEIIVKTQPHTDKFLLQQIVHADWNPEVYSLKIGVDSPNGNKKKSQFPEANFFYAKVQKVIADSKNPDAVSRPITAEIGKVCDPNDVDQETSYSTLAYDHRLRKNEFGRMSNPGTKVWVRDSILKFPHKKLSKTSHLLKRKQLAEFQSKDLVTQAANFMQKIQKNVSIFIKSIIFP